MRNPALACIAIGFVVACGPPKKGGTTGDDDDVQIDAPSGDVDAYVVQPDASCGSQAQQIGVVNLGDPPDLLIVLDRSGSMADFPAAFPPIFTPKWQIMRTAVNSVAAAKDMQIKFGLLEFPSDTNCAADATAEVGIGLGVHTAIANYFTNRSPGGNTPAQIGLASALTYYNGIPINTAGRYVLFATDGLPNCGGAMQDQASDAETIASVTALFNAGVKTFVLGFGQFGGNATLNSAAVAGGKPRPGSTKYYEANNQADLDAALQAIAGGIIVPSCSFHLQSAPPDPNNVTVNINGMAVPRSPSHGNGWDYYPDAMTITFFGTYCTTIMQGATTDVGFAYGCPGPVIN